jgi:hypothetical protein
MHEKMMNSTKIILIIIIIFMVGCSSEYLYIKNTTIQQETALSKLNPSYLQSLVALEKKESGDVFTEAKLITLKDYKIVFSDNSNEIYILRRDKIIVGVDGGGVVYIYDSPEAPLAGSEVVVFGKNYIKYRGPNYVYEDYGLNGLNILEGGKYADYGFDKENLNTISKRNGKICKSTSFYGVACCIDESNQSKPFKFSYDSGWIPMSYNEKTKSLCK